MSYCDYMGWSSSVKWIDCRNGFITELANTNTGGVSNWWAELVVLINHLKQMWPTLYRGAGLK